MFSWFNTSPEVFYFYVYANRIFDKVEEVCYINPSERTDQEATGQFTEAIERVEIRYRHQYLPYKKSIDLHITQIKEDLLREFRCNLRIVVALTDEQCYQDQCQKDIAWEAELVTMLR